MKFSIYSKIFTFKLLRFLVYHDLTSLYLKPGLLGDPGHLVAGPVEEEQDRRQGSVRVESDVLGTEGKLRLVTSEYVRVSE